MNVTAAALSLDKATWAPPAGAGPSSVTTAVGVEMAGLFGGAVVIPREAGTSSGNVE